MTSGGDPGLRPKPVHQGGQWRQRISQLSDSSTRNKTRLKPLIMVTAETAFQVGRACLWNGHFFDLGYAATLRSCARFAAASDAGAGTSGR